MRWSLRCAIIGLLAASAFPALGDPPRKAVDIDSPDSSDSDSMPPTADATAPDQGSQAEEAAPAGEDQKPSETAPIQPGQDSGPRLRAPSPSRACRRDRTTP